MIDIKVLGPGCANCEELLKRTHLAADELKLESSIEKVSDLVQIASYGVMMTPALVVNGQTVVSGKVPSVEEIKTMLVR